MINLLIPIARRPPDKLGMVLLVWCLSFPTPVTAAENDHRVTVAVLGLFRPERIDVSIEQDVIVLMRNGSTDVRRVLANGQRLQVESSGEQLKISFLESDGRLLLGHRADAVRTEETVFTLNVPGRIRRDFFGRLEVKARDGLLLPRITVKEESAVQQILQSEMADVQQTEALRAQAVLVRGYLRTSKGRHRKDGYDFCDTTHCQFFTEFKSVASRFSKAANGTEGLVLTFLGKPIQPLYTAVCGGRTLAGFADRYGPKEGSGYPFRSVSCRFCVGHLLFEWETKVETQELIRILQDESGRDPAEILARLAVPEDNGESRALKQAVRIRVGRALGWNIIRSNRYSVEVHSNLVKVRGHGSGHNFGLCQVGAVEMSRQGMSMKEILSFYFPGCSIGQ
jgi:stage II sporulation protein D